MQCDVCWTDIKGDNWMHHKCDNKTRCMPCTRVLMKEFWGARGMKTYLEVHEKKQGEQLDLFAINEV